MVGVAISGWSIAWSATVSLRSLATVLLSVSLLLLSVSSALEWYESGFLHLNVPSILVLVIVVVAHACSNDNNADDNSDDQEYKNGTKDSKWLRLGVDDPTVLIAVVSI